MTFAEDVARSRFGRAYVTGCVVAVSTALIQVVFGLHPADPVVLGFVAGLAYWWGAAG